MSDPARRDETARDTAPDMRSLADLVDEVFAALQPAVTRATVIRTVRRCRRELDIVHGSAQPERVRHLALARLQRPAQRPAQRTTQGSA
jgi:hypothetical protein